MSDEYNYLVEMVDFDQQVISSLNKSTPGKNQAVGSNVVRIELCKRDLRIDKGNRMGRDNKLRPFWFTLNISVLKISF
jgi:hypothetical protein